MRYLGPSAVFIWFLCGTFSGLEASSIVIGDDFAQPIPAQGDGEAWMEPVSLFVDEHFFILDLNVYLDITHTDVSDLLIYLDSPGGVSLWLKDYQLYDPRWKGQYPAKPNMYGTIFDDESPLNMIDGEPPYTGHFRPAESLNVFDGLDAYGCWSLRIRDEAFLDSGTLDRWELRFETTVAPEPAGLVYLILPIFFGKLRKSSPYTR